MKVQVPKVCNKCGRSCLVYYNETSASNYSIDISYDAIYGSYALADGLRYEFTLCEGCLGQLIKSLSVTPRVINWLYKNFLE